MAYNLYFGKYGKFGDRDKFWAPNSYCTNCQRTLTDWLKGTHSCMPFAIPMFGGRFVEGVQDTGMQYVP